MYLGLIGTNGAGKTAICDYLKEKKGFAFFSLSDIVRSEAQKRGLAQTRDNLVQTGNDLKSKNGLAILAQLSFEKAQNNPNPNIVFDSIRNIAEVQFLKEKGVRMIGVDAPVELRYQRIQARKRESDMIDFETFVKHDERENSGVSLGQNIKESLAQCEVVINNTGDLQNLLIQIDQILAHKK